MVSTTLSTANRSARKTLLCFSHLRWNFVYQRPQHVISRFARDYDVLYVEEPLPSGDGTDWLQVRTESAGIKVLVPFLSVEGDQAESAQAALLDDYLETRAARDLLLWYYTPMSLGFSRHLPRSLTVYDCMDELSAFLGAPPKLLEREAELLEQADVVFTGGYSLFEAKRKRHNNVHCFPSSVDIRHFAQARSARLQPADQARIARPRLGFYGVLDERLDIRLLDQLARRCPEWQFILVGPIAKIDPKALPRHTNIHYLGSKTYEELPAYLAGWDVALMPFALNESTRFISPTKTPEYLAGGRPVVSTPITDVVRTYGGCDIVHIAADADAFVRAIQRALDQSRRPEWLYRQADAVLGDISWDTTWQGMNARLHDIEAARSPATVTDLSAHIPDKDHRQKNSGRRRTAAYDYLVVGAGFAGSVMAERLAAGSGKRVLVVDRRPHIGGNAYDHYNADGILVHRYGPHIFHTNSEKVLDYLSRFTSWRPYEHRVLAHVKDMLVPIPINLTTLSTLYGRPFSAEQARAFLDERAEAVDLVRTSEDVIVSTVGRELYELFFRGYTRKQWGIDPSDLDRSVTARIPTRTTDDDRYFSDRFQVMPKHGYTRLFENMLDHPNIDVLTSTTYEDVRDRVSYDHLIYCGPIDAFFDYRFGTLPYRSLKFDHITLDQRRFQPAAVVNYPDEDIPYTRITEYKYLTGQTHAKTSITYEYPSAEGDPYYPIPRPANAALYQKYQDLADETPGVTFVGRLASYRYYNMDQVVAQALSVYSRMAQGPAPRVPASATSAVRTASMP